MIRKIAMLACVLALSASVVHAEAPLFSAQYIGGAPHGVPVVTSDAPLCAAYVQVGGACWWYPGVDNTRIRVSIADNHHGEAVGAVVRAIRLGGGPKLPGEPDTSRLGEWRFCGAGTFTVPANTGLIQIAVNGIGSDMPCGSFATTGTITVTRA